MNVMVWKFVLCLLKIWWDGSNLITTLSFKNYHFTIKKSCKDLVLGIMNVLYITSLLARTVWKRCIMAKIALKELNGERLLFPSKNINEMPKYCNYHRTRCNHIIEILQNQYFWTILQQEEMLQQNLMNYWLFLCFCLSKLCRNADQ